MTVTEITYQVDTLELAALTRGKPSDRPVLCLHGYLDNAASFLPLLKQTDFLPNEYLVAIDWPGHGCSQHRSLGAHYHFFDYVSDLLTLHNENNWPAIDIIAHSMGAMVATAFAAAFPDKVKSLTLIDAFGFVCCSAENTTKQLQQGLLTRTKKVNTQRTFSLDTAVKARLNVSDLNEENARLIVQRALTQITQHSDNLTGTAYAWQTDPRLKAISPYRLTEEQAQQLLKDIRCPTKLIIASDGMQSVKQGLARYAKFISQLSCDELVGGHHVHMEQPTLVAKLIEKFYLIRS